MTAPPDFSAAEVRDGVNALPPLHRDEDSDLPGVASGASARILACAALFNCLDSALTVGGGEAGEFEVFPSQTEAKRRVGGSCYVASRL